MADKRQKLIFPLPIVVEGKYDKMKVSEVAECDIITTDGFGIFNKKEKLALIRALSVNGIVILCDSDGAGGVIRRHIMGAVDPSKVYNLYIPQIEGKERRKKEASKEGTLGVEGMEADLICDMLKNLADRLGIDCTSGTLEGKEPRKAITKADMYEAGLTGHAGSREKRDELAQKLGLPSAMTAPALLGAVNILLSRDEFLEMTGLAKSEGEQ